MTTMTLNCNVLIQARYRAGLRQRDLADAAGISRQYLSDLEHGKCNISPPVAKRLADVLGLTIDDIITFDVHSHSPTKKIGHGETSKTGA